MLNDHLFANPYQQSLPKLVGFNRQMIEVYSSKQVLSIAKYPYAHSIRLLLNQITLNEIAEKILHSKLQMPKSIEEYINIHQVHFAYHCEQLFNQNNNMLATTYIDELGKAIHNTKPDSLLNLRHQQRTSEEDHNKAIKAMLKPAQHASKNAFINFMMPSI